ncbi:type IV secretion system protein [Aminobacter sp. MSH1]|uniref:virB8 family protein n=1 Tax=Aminobacter sp. MSH1 TaxID=374606 RepID=UPI000D3C0095|nr:type IV secretion system protein [Aminobacter sp. MSH1]
MLGSPKGAQPQAAQSEAEQGHFKRSISWEDSVNKMLVRSERRAWWVVKLLSFALFGTGAAIVVMMPLKENTPYVWLVDQKTGRPDLMTAVDAYTSNFNEANDKYWLAQYVQSRETYDWYTIQKDYDAVGLLSSREVGAAYARLFEGENALDRRYGASIKETIKILSVVPNGKNIGTVRFVKTTQRVADAASPGTSQVWVATIGYEFKPGTFGRESTKLVNPFGFRVTSYRADAELAGGAQ